jgi:hypothetical protein
MFVINTLATVFSIFGIQCLQFVRFKLAFSVNSFKNCLKRLVLLEKKGISREKLSKIVFHLGLEDSLEGAEI